MKMPLCFKFAQRSRLVSLPELDALRTWKEMRATLAAVSKGQMTVQVPHVSAQLVRG